MKKNTAFILAAVVTLVAAGSVLAEDPPPSPWSGSGELSFVSTSGNTDTQSVGLGFALTYKPGVWTTELKLGYIRNETDGELSAEKTTGLVGARRSLNERFDAYGRASYLKNEFAGVKSNWGFEAGGLYKALTGDRHFLDVTAGVGYTIEDRVSEANKDFAMGTAGFAYKWKISETTDLTNDFGFVFDFDDSDNWRLANATAVTTAINTIFSLKASYSLNYQNQPSIGFEKRDSVTSVSLVAKF